jgi:hypothetical protein
VPTSRQHVHPGAAAALRWLTLGGPGPLTGALATPITFEAIVRELATAEAIIYGPPSDGRQYARGVEHALLWAETPRRGPARSRSRAETEPTAPGKGNLFELTDAMLCADRPVRSLVNLTLVAEHRRMHHQGPVRG